jgi:hypothetical protein
MTSANYLKNYVERVQDVPAYLRRHLALIRYESNIIYFKIFFHILILLFAEIWMKRSRVYKQK